MKGRKTYKRRKLSEDLSHLKCSSLALDPWQIGVTKVEGNMSLRTGRQCGKSTIISQAAVNFALKNSKVKVLVIAAAQRESSFIFEKMRAEIEFLPQAVLAEKPTQTKMILSNGSEIHSLPTGRTGFLIRGQTIDLLIGDEAAYIAELVWLSVIPMIAVSRKLRGFGWVWMLSTPFGNQGYFYDSFKDPNFTNFHMSSEDCERIDSKILESERTRLTRAEYKQEWCGEFVEHIDKFFATKLIKKCSVDEENLKINARSRYFLGVDVARYGIDENAFVIAELQTTGKLRIVEAMTTERKALTHTRDVVKQLHQKYNFNRIYIDDTGVGGGLTDMLVELYKRKVIGINNAQKSIDGDRKRKVIKEDLYSNALVLMEDSKLDMVANLDLYRSLDMTRFQYTEDKNIRIYGKNQHLAEAFVRACWCWKDKSLKLFFHSF